MEAVSLPRLAKILGGKVVGGARSRAKVRNVSIHSDHIGGQTAFFALQGTRADGHAFVGRALANGAAAAVVASDRVDGLETHGRPLIVVEDPRQALRTLAEWWRSQLTATFVAVVGNVGKTVTKDALVHFLRADRPVFGSPGSYNSQIGVPLSILQCPKDAAIAVIEAAATEPGEMHRHASLIRPDHVVLTNIGTRWDSNFDGEADQAVELIRIADAMKPPGWLVLGDSDDDLHNAVAPLPNEVYWLDESAGLPHFSGSGYGAEGISITVTFPGTPPGVVAVRTPSDHIMTDVKLALCAAWLLGVAPASLFEAAADYQPTSARMEVWHSPAGVTMVRDVASADGATFAGAARVAKRLTKPGGRTTVVLADNYDDCSDAEALSLGKMMGRAEIAELCTLDLPIHKLIARGAHAVDATLTIQTFSSPIAMQEHLNSTLGASDVVLIQSPRDTTISDLSHSLVEPMASTRLYIDQASVESNVLAIRRMLDPSVQVMGMVKALAYGTNPIQLSICLEAAGVDALAVAAVDEGVALRRAGVSLDTILVTLATEAELVRMARYDLTVLLYSPAMVDAVIAHAERGGPPLTVHLKVDSGMHRTGLPPKEAIKALERLRAVSGLTLAGLMTHFACADMPEQDAFTLRQLATFEGVIDAAHKLGLEDIVCHAANTAATVRLPSTRLNMVRIGIGLYGVYPAAETTDLVRLKPAVSLVAKIVEVHRLPAGEPVGYGATFRTPAKGTRIGVVAAGYHDCVPRAFSNVGAVMVNGIPCPIVGTVSMDSMTIDLTACPDATVGTDVTIYGRHGESFVSIEEAARKADTIPYELLARIGPRVQRVLTRH